MYSSYSLKFNITLNDLYKKYRYFVNQCLLLTGKEDDEYISTFVFYYFKNCQLGFVYFSVNILFNFFSIYHKLRSSRCLTISPSCDSRRVAHPTSSSPPVWSPARMKRWSSSSLCPLKVVLKTGWPKCLRRCGKPIISSRKKPFSSIVIIVQGKIIIDFNFYKFYPMWDHHIILDLWARVV